MQCCCWPHCLCSHSSARRTSGKRCNGNTAIGETVTRSTRPAQGRARPDSAIHTVCRSISSGRAAGRRCSSWRRCIHIRRSMNQAFISRKHARIIRKWRIICLSIRQQAIAAGSFRATTKPSRQRIMFTTRESQLRVFQPYWGRIRLARCCTTCGPQVLPISALREQARRIRSHQAVGQLGSTADRNRDRGEHFGSLSNGWPSDARCLRHRRLQATRRQRRYQRVGEIITGLTAVAAVAAVAARRSSRLRGARRAPPSAAPRARNRRVGAVLVPASRSPQPRARCSRGP